jgi:hypothetical protein
VTVAFLFWQSWTSNNEKDTFIEDREASFKNFEDSLLVINKYFYDENKLSNGRLDSLSLLNDSLSTKINGLEASLQNMKNDYSKNRDAINDLDAESTVDLLSINLSKRIVD